MAFRFWPTIFRRPKIIAADQSATPILDLQEPFPKPTDQIVTGKFAAPFLIFVGVLVVTQNLSFLIVPFGLLLILFLCVAVHESGHLIAGWCVGLRFMGVKVGPVSIRRIRGEFAINLRPRIAQGEKYMSLDCIRQIKRKLATVTLGGPIASYICGVTVFVVGEVYRANSDSRWSVFLGFFGFFSFIFAVVSSIPFRTPLVLNDASLLRALLCSKEISGQMITAHALLYDEYAKPLVQPPYRARWYRVAAEDPRPFVRDFYRDWNLYRATDDPRVAELCLERLLKNAAPLPPEARDNLVAEAVHFTGWRERMRLKQRLGRNESSTPNGWDLCLVGGRRLRHALRASNSMKH